MDFCSRIFLVFPAISLRRSHDDDFRRMEIGPAGTRLATKSAVALVDEVRSLWDFDADLAAEAGELQHSHCPISRATRLVEPVRFPHSSRFQLGRARVPSVRFSPLDRVGSWLGRGVPPKRRTGSCLPQQRDFLRPDTDGRVRLMHYLDERPLSESRSCTRTTSMGADRTPVVEMEPHPTRFPGYVMGGRRSMAGCRVVAGQDLNLPFRTP